MLFEQCGHHFVMPACLANLFHRHHRQSSLPKDTPNPPPTNPVFPWVKVLTIGMTLLVNFLSIQIVFPFLPFMVHDFFPDLDPSLLGYRAGYLASALFVGQFAGAFLWGWVSDKIGRRPVLLCGLAATTICAAVFGFSKWYSYALIVRFLWGFLNGNMGVCTTYLAEILDEANHVRGFAIFGMQGGLGRLLGPGLGGLLSNLSDRNSSLQNNAVLRTFPYLVPCLAGSFMGLVGFIATYRNLPETLGAAKTGKAEEGQNASITESAPKQNGQTHQEVTDTLRLSTGAHKNGLQHHTTQGYHQLDEEYDQHLLSHAPSASSTPQLHPGVIPIELDPHMSPMAMKPTAEQATAAVPPALSLSDPQDPTHPTMAIANDQPDPGLNDSGSSLPPPEPAVDPAAPSMNEGPHDHTEAPDHSLIQMPKSDANASQSRWSHPTSNHIKALLTNKGVVFTTLLYGMLSFVQQGIQEIVPLLVLNDRAHGGYLLKASDIGIIVMCAGPFQLCSQMWLTPRTVKRWGQRRVFFGCASIVSICMIGIPWLDSLDLCCYGLQMVSLAVLYILVITVCSMAFTCAMVLNSNSALPDQRSRVNGISQTIISFFRLVSPTFFGNLFAFTESQTEGLGFQLFDFHFPFELLALILFLLGLGCLHLPTYLEKKPE